MNTTPIGNMQAVAFRHNTSRTTSRPALQTTRTHRRRVPAKKPFALMTDPLFGVTHSHIQQCRNRERSTTL